MGLHKRMLWRGLDMALPEMIEEETRALHLSMAKPDAIEGGMAYVERRSPEWKTSVNQDWPEWLQ